MLDNLRKLRKENNLTQKDMAIYLGISQNNYSYWETGKVKIDNISLDKLAKYFNVTIDYLLGREKKPSDIKQPLDLKRLYSACQTVGLDPAKIDNLSPEQLEQIITLVRVMLKDKNNIN